MAGRDGLADCLAAAGAGDAVLLAPGPTTGIFTLTDSSQLGSNLTLTCMPGVRIELQGASIRIDFGVNVTIRRCNFDGAANATMPAFAVNSSTHIRFEDNEFSNFRAPAIYSQAGGVSHLDILRNRFVDVGDPNANDAAVYIDAQNGPPASKIRIIGNTCDDESTAAGFVKIDASASGSVRGLQIADNIIVASAPAAGPTIGVELYATDGLNDDIRCYEISRNTIILTTPAPQTICISAYGSDGRIAGNSLQNCQWIGIEINGSRSSVRGNALSATGPINWDGSAQSRADVEIKDNALFATVGADAIHLLAGGQGTALRDAEIAGNLIDAPRTTLGLLGIQVLGSGGHISNVSVHNNTLAGFSTAQTHGAIDTEGIGISGITIESNYFSADSGVAMFLNGGTQIGIGANHFAGPMARVATYGRTSVTDPAAKNQSMSCCGH